jgi:hypothetical protein
MLACAYASTHACSKIEHFGNLQFGHAVCSSAYAGGKVCWFSPSASLCTRLCACARVRARMPARASPGTPRTCWEGRGGRGRRTLAHTVCEAAIVINPDSLPFRPTQTRHDRTRCGGSLAN